MDEKTIKTDLTAVSNTIMEYLWGKIKEEKPVFTGFSSYKAESEAPLAEGEG